ncbi:recombination protein O N-terminal domain-containing protein [Novosphingobium sp. Chol11]|uniref:recombination protein O N-terminal domain-containing protein n=1 Tax=Novosphingobium sp. Chol11 TaxID=1385763 RepID=UPI0025F0DF50|nr:recombination protein O N-terminal domain-containing protein [Novosphingobium sp. Chol11]
MLIRAPAILCASFAHGEHGAVARLFTADHGLLAAYVAGARGRMLRPLLIPGNVLEIELNERGDSQLASVRLELVVSRGPWLTEPLASAGIGWAAALTAATLPEGQPYAALHSALLALLDAICHAPSARGWARALAGYEALVLREAGYAVGQGLSAAPPADMPWAQLLALLDRQGAAIGNRLLADRRRDVMAARAILMDRLKRISAS